MNDVTIGSHCNIEKTIIAEEAKIGDRVKTGEGEEVENEEFPGIYNHGLVTIAEKSIIPSNLSIGKNTVLSGEFKENEFTDNIIPSGKSIIKGGDRA